MGNYLHTKRLWPGVGDVDITGPCRAAYSEGPGYTEYLDRKFQRVSLNLYNKSEDGTLYKANIAYFHMF